MHRATQAYMQTRITTTDQGQVVVMLYDGALKFLTQAKDKIREKDYANKGILISKAMDIINELDSSLNMEKGGDLSQNLHNLYFFCNTKLLQANLKMDIAIIDQIISILSGLRSAFAEISSKPEAQAAVQEASKNPRNMPQAKGFQHDQASAPATTSMRASNLYSLRTAEIEQPRPAGNAPDNTLSGEAASAQATPPPAAPLPETDNPVFANPMAGGAMRAMYKRYAQG